MVSTSYKLKIFTRIERVFIGMPVLVFFATLATSAAPTTPNAAVINKLAKVEYKLTQAIAAYEQGEYAVAEKQLQAILELDKKNYIAHEYLALINERNEKLSDSVNHLSQARKLAPKKRRGFICYHLGRLYTNLKDQEKAIEALQCAIQYDAFLVASNYSLGFLYYSNHRYREAEAYLYKAWLLARDADATEVEKKYQQSIAYYLAEISARYSRDVQAIRFVDEVEAGSSFEIRNTAWRLKSELGNAGFAADVGAYLGYDSNVVLLPNSSILPTDFASKAAITNTVVGNVAYQSSLTSPFQWRVPVTVYVKNNWHLDLGGYDVLYMHASPEIAWTNRRDYRLQVNYLASNSIVDRKNWYRFHTNHGPDVSITYTPYDRWRYRLGARYLMNDFTFDLPVGPDRRSGAQLSIYGEAVLDALNPRFRPRIALDYTVDATLGQNFQAKWYRGLLGLESNITERLLVDVSGRYALGDYVNHLQDREDALLEFSVVGSYTLKSDLRFICNFSYINQTSSLRVFTYERFIFSSGIVYTLF